MELKGRQPGRILVSLLLTAGVEQHRVVGDVLPQDLEDAPAHPVPAEGAARGALALGGAGAAGIEALLEESDPGFRQSRRPKSRG